MLLNKTITQILASVAALPSAEKIVIFGSVATNGENPGDLDLCLMVEDCEDWNGALATYAPTIQALRKLAYKNYGYLDPFVKTSSMLVVRNDAATGWQRAKNSRGLIAAIRKDGVPIRELMGRLGAELSSPSTCATNADSEPVQNHQITRVRPR